MSLKKLDAFPKSFLTTLKKTDYSQWQRHNTAKKADSVKISLPPVRTATAKTEDKKLSPSKPKDKLSGNKSTSASHSKGARSRRGRTGQHKAMGSEAKHAKSMANIRILQRFSKAKRNSVEELKHHSHVLLEKNRRLMEDIQEMDADMTRRARDLLQQYDMFGTIITTLQDSRQNQVGVAKAEFQALEKTVEKNMGELELEMGRMNAKVRVLQEELNVLRTYMDKEHPVKSVQISSLLRSIQDLREEQQDELEEAQEMAKQFSEKIAKKTKEETERILQAVVGPSFGPRKRQKKEEKVSEYQKGLQEMARNNQELRRQIELQKEIIDDLEKEVEVLRKHSAGLREYIRHSRYVIFEDVLLQRPICSPSMEIVLNIPTEEDLPL